MYNNNSKFFNNKSCEYFPCHKTDDPDSFNCFYCYCPLYALGDSCGGNTFGNSCYSNTFGYDCDSNTFGDGCESNTFGTEDQNNNLLGYIRYVELGGKCRYVTVNTLGTNVYFDGLEVGDFVQAVEVPAAQVGTSGRYRLENYSNTGETAISANGSATLIHKTGYGTETAVSTTDGGTTWTAV